MISAIDAGKPFQYKFDKMMKAINDLESTPTAVPNKFREDLISGMVERDLIITRLNMIVHHLFEAIDEGETNTVVVNVARIQYKSMLEEKELKVKDPDNYVGDLLGV